MTLRNQIDKVLRNILVGIMSIMVINVVWQVFTRFIIGSPSAFTDELSRYLMIWLGILGAAYVSGQNLHVSIDILPAKLHESNQKRLKYFVNCIIILFAFLAMVIGGLRLVYLTYILEQTSPALQLPLAIVYLIIPISGILIIYFKIYDIIKLNQ